MDNAKTMQERLAEKICKALEKQPGGWECAIVGYGEPKMPAELILEDAE